MTLAEKLRFHRTAKGYSQRALAELLGMERSTYSNYETGKTQPSIQDLLRLARLYGVTMESLACEDCIPPGFALPEEMHRHRFKGAIPEQLAAELEKKTME